MFYIVHNIKIQLEHKSLAGRMIWQNNLCHLEDFKIVLSDFMTDDNYTKNDLHSIGKEYVGNIDVFGAWYMSYIRNGEI